MIRPALFRCLVGVLVGCGLVVMSVGASLIDSPVRLVVR